MLTEIDTRDMAGRSVSLWMDTDAQVYLVCLEGHAPIHCLTRERALAAFRHPYIYVDSEEVQAHGMPLEGSVSLPNATEGDTPRPLTSGGELSHRTADALIDLRNVLAEMNVTDFEWTAASVDSMIHSLRAWHHSKHETGPPPEPPKPYDHGEDDIEF